MAEPSTPQNVIDLALRMGKLESQAREFAETTHRRMMGTRIVGVILIIFIAVYLTYAHKRIAAVDAQMAAHGARTYIEDTLPDLRRSVQENLKNDAAKNVGLVEAQLKELPKQVTVWLRDEFQKRAEDKITEIEPQIEEILRGSLAATRQEIGDREIGEEEARQMITETVSQFKNDAQQHVDKIYGEYSQPAKEIAKYLEILATSNELTDRQKIQRDTIVTFLAVLARHDLDFTIDIDALDASAILNPGEKG